MTGLIAFCFISLIVVKYRKRIYSAGMSAVYDPPPATTTMPPPQQLMAVPMQKPALPVAGTCVVATCPTGLKPGDALQVAGPAGQMMQVQVPLGVAPGGQFAVQMPAAPVGMAAQPGVAMAARRCKPPIQAAWSWPCRRRRTI